MPHVLLTMKSANKKTGPIPVSTTAAETCPTACPLNTKNAGGCYAAYGPLALIWRRVSNGEFGGPWDAFLDAIRKLPTGQFWRHNQAGDLPGVADKIDADLLASLVEANKGRRGFTYTHKPLTAENATAIANANANGFTINLSGNNLNHADELADAGIGPVVTILPVDMSGDVAPVYKTPKGRKVAVCPATYKDDVSCASCQLCQRVDRKVIVGFPVHGTAKKRAGAIASS